MSFSKLAPSAALLNEIMNIGVLLATDAYNNYVEQLPITIIPTDGIDDSTSIGQIKNLNILINKHVLTAKKHAEYWFKYVDDDILDTYTYLRYYANHFKNYYSSLLSYSQNGNPEKLVHRLLRLKAKSNECLTFANKTMPFLEQFKINLATDTQNFKTDYETQKTTLTGLTKVRDDLDKQIDNLQSQLNDLNKKVTQEAINMGLNSLKDGVMVIANAVTENAVGVVSSGALLAIDVYKGEANIIIMDKEAIDILHKMAPLLQQLGKVDSDLQALKNLGNQLLTLQSKGELSWKIINVIQQYFSETNNYIQELIDDIDKNDIPKFDDNEENVLNQWKEIESDLNDFLSFNIGTVMETWNYSQVKLVPLSEKDQYLSETT